MKKKMCKYNCAPKDADIVAAYCTKEDGNCPKGTNMFCEIVEPKMVKVKAWITPPETKREAWIATSYKMSTDIPCTILIDKKYLKGRK